MGSTVVLLILTFTRLLVRSILAIHFIVAHPRIWYATFAVVAHKLIVGVTKLLIELYRKEKCQWKDECTKKCKRRKKLLCKYAQTKSTFTMVGY